MTEQIRVPNDLIDSLAWGVRLASQIVMAGDAEHEGVEVAALAEEWSVKMDGLRRDRLVTPPQAAQLRAVIEESAEFAFTCRYGDEVDGQSFPQDHQFAQQAEELLLFLGAASESLVRG
jgi:hypothetical protein